jgi:2-polyprenyl-3-methyl-5-hydroxy-6-metoxy-1,4-benzoquinol methylase
MSQYSENQFVQSDNHSWSLLFQYIDDNSTVLDVGCSSGTLGEVLIREKNCTVDGLELFHNDAVLARKKLRKIYELNVESDDLGDIIDKYDFIIFADVIEHLVNPVAALTEVKKLLKPTGAILYSIPNMAHISIRLELMQGNFDYTETGLLDETHLHFYTKNHIEDIFAEAGYAIKDQKYTYMNYPHKFVENRLKKLGLSVGDSSKFATIMNKVEAQAFQFIGCAINTKSTKKHKLITELPHKKDAEALNVKLQEYEDTIHELRHTATEQQQMIVAQSLSLQKMQNSVSWRLTRPLRSAIARISKH